MRLGRRRLESVGVGWGRLESNCMSSLVILLSRVAVRAWIQAQQGASWHVPLVVVAVALTSSRQSSIDLFCSSYLDEGMAKNATDV